MSSPSSEDAAKHVMVYNSAYIVAGAANDFYWMLEAIPGKETEYVLGKTTDKDLATDFYFEVHSSPNIRIDTSRSMYIYALVNGQRFYLSPLSSEKDIQFFEVEDVLSRYIFARRGDTSHASYRGRFYIHDIDASVEEIAREHDGVTPRSLVQRELTYRIQVFNLARGLNGQCVRMSHEFQEPGSSGSYMFTRR